MVKYVYFEDSWNETERKDRTGEVFDGGIIPTGKTSDDTKKPRRQN